MLLEIRAGLVLVPLEVAEANRSHFASLGASGRPGEGLRVRLFRLSQKRRAGVSKQLRFPAKASAIMAFSSRSACNRSSKFPYPGAPS
jgi:hypothetical protein